MRGLRYEYTFHSTKWDSVSLGSYFQINKKVIGPKWELKAAFLDVGEIFKWGFVRIINLNVIIACTVVYVTNKYFYISDKKLPSNLNGAKEALC